MFLFLYVLKNFAHLIRARCNWSFVRNVRDVLQVITKYAKLCRNGIIGHFCHSTPSAVCIKHQPRLGVVGITSRYILLIPFCVLRQGDFLICSDNGATLFRSRVIYQNFQSISTTYEFWASLFAIDDMYPFNLTSIIRKKIKGV